MMRLNRIRWLQKFAAGGQAGTWVGKVSLGWFYKYKLIEKTDHPWVHRITPKGLRDLEFAISEYAHRPGMDL